MADIGNANDETWKPESANYLKNGYKAVLGDETGALAYEMAGAVASEGAAVLSQAARMMPQAEEPAQPPVPKNSARAAETAAEFDDGFLYEEAAQSRGATPKASGTTEVDPRLGADGPRNRATFEEYRTELRRDMSAPHVEDSKLQNLVGDLYRPGAKVGSGSTADAIREERANPGTLVGGRDHTTTKGPAYKTALTGWLESNPTARPGDRAAAENILLDLIDALR